MVDLLGSQINPEHVLRYGVYTFRTATQDGIVYSRSFIVLRNAYDVIVRFTRLQDYAGFKNYKPITSDAEKKLYYICGMLNYVLVDNGKRFGIRHVFGITTEMMQEYFDYYASEKKADGDYRGKDSINKCISAVTAFMANLAWKFGSFVKVTVQLVLRGEDIGTIQFWRGDSSPESAFTYLQNKGDLTRELTAAGDRMMELLISEWKEDDHDADL